MTIRDTTYTIAGVVIGDADDHRDVIFVPWTTLQKSLGVAHLQTVTIAAAKAGESSRIGEDITQLLRKRHKAAAAKPKSTSAQQAGYLAAQGGAEGAPDDFTVKTQAAQALTKGLYTPAAAFALANLPQLDQVNLEEMADTLDHASDTDDRAARQHRRRVARRRRHRHHEHHARVRHGADARDRPAHGHRRAHERRGAAVPDRGGDAQHDRRPRRLVLGLISPRIVGWTLGWPTHISLASIALAVGIAATVGLVFGNYPARRAARLDPIDALRSE